MGQKKWRPGIRPQLTIIVLLAAVVSTVATLFVTENAVLNYVTQQAHAQQQQHMKIATLVLDTSFGQNLSVSSDNLIVADSPTISADFKTLNSNNGYGRYQLNGDTDYVDLVQQLIGGMVSVYQCADKDGNPITPCARISTTFRTGSDFNAPRAINGSQYDLSTSVAQSMRLTAATPQDWVGTDTIDGKQYYVDYSPLLNPQKQVIGVMMVGVLLQDVTGVVANTTVELVIIGTVIMVLGVILALFVASAIVGTLQRAARQVGSASEHFGEIAAQQASGSSQQVWAINAINQALQSLSETATDISRRTDQLAQMGNQVLQRRAEISPTQIDSIIAYITRSVRDISVASRQQAATYQRMTGAMQAVTEVAEQVAGDSKRTSENANRLENVVQQLRQLVGVTRRGTPGAVSTDSMNGAENGRRGTVQAVRPMRGGTSGKLVPARPELAGVGALAAPGMGAGMGAGADGFGMGRRGMRPGSEGAMGNAAGFNMGGRGAPGMSFGGADPMAGNGASWMSPGGQPFGGQPFGGQPYGGMDQSGQGGYQGYAPRNGFGGQLNPPANGPLAGAAPGGWNPPVPNSGPSGNFPGSFNGPPNGGWNFGNPPSLPGMAAPPDFGVPGSQAALPPLVNPMGNEAGTTDVNFPWMQSSE